MINVKNDYKVARVVQDCIFVALSILQFALGITGLLATALFLIYFGATIFGTLDDIDKNSQVIERLQAIGTLMATGQISQEDLNNSLPELIKKIS